jgi:hypothetical protein
MKDADLYFYYHSTDDADDEHLPGAENARGAFVKVIVRSFIAVPVGLVALLLCMSVIGLPLGLPLALAIGAWVSKPLREHPTFNVKGDAE